MELRFAFMLRAANCNRKLLRRSLKAGVDIISMLQDEKLVQAIRLRRGMFANVDVV